MVIAIISLITAGLAFAGAIIDFWLRIRGHKDLETKLLIIHKDQSMINEMLINAMEGSLSNNTDQNINKIILRDLSLIYKINNRAYNNS